ncbi:MAG: CRISPR-associated endonuclease Cas1 [Alphaproteobacteria bacterium]|nr:CRISPR-associated endonuclease Cas1 [Alphaproteobacteria bacterium]
MELEAVLCKEDARIVEIAEDRRTVALSGHEIVIAGGDREAERIPVDAIAGMVAWRPGPSWAAAALAALTERGAGIVLRGPNHDSHSLAWPVPNRPWPARIRAQLDLYPPYARHLLRQLERARDAQRMLALETMGGKGRLQALRASPRQMRGRRVAKRTPDEVAGEIARHYWPWLVGRGFRRDPARRGANAVVNCGHTALRVAATRAIHAAGLHPGAGLHERTGLADDLMIPYRPVVELAAAVFIATGSARADARTEAAFAWLLAAPLRGRRGPVQIRLGLAELARALAHCFETGDQRLDLLLPARQDPDTLFALLQPTAVSD